MRIIENWQYKYVEKCLYNYHLLKHSPLDTEKRIVKAIDKAVEFFKDTNHEIMIKEFYFKADEYRKKYTPAGHHQRVCQKYLHTETSNGFVIRREIIYKVAMNCYAYQIFKP